MTWSPDPAFDDLIAVGYQSGKVDLLRLQASRSAKNPSLSSGPSVTLPVRNSRSCNALAFCSADPHYLAVGLDKVRGDASLVIWDVLTATPTLSVKSPTQLTFNVPPSVANPRPQPQIPRGDLAPRTDPRVLQQLAAADVVSSVAFLPKSTTLLLAGISHRWLRLFDLRNPQPTVFTAASKVHGIATDPFDPHRIGCYGEGNATIWDARRLSHPLITFTEKDASADGERVKPNATLCGMEFSPIRRGSSPRLNARPATSGSGTCSRSSSLTGRPTGVVRGIQRSRRELFASRGPRATCCHGTPQVGAKSPDRRLPWRTKN